MDHMPVEKYTFYFMNPKRLLNFKKSDKNPEIFGAK